MEEGMIYAKIDQCLNAGSNVLATAASPRTVTNCQVLPSDIILPGPAPSRVSGKTQGAYRWGMIGVLRKQ